MTPTATCCRTPSTPTPTTRTTSSRTSRPTPRIPAAWRRSATTLWADALKKSARPLTRRYFYDGMRLIEEQDVAQNPTATYVYGNALDELLMAKQFGSGATYFYQQNALGSVSAVTNAVGTPMERYRYDAFGKPKVTDGNGTVIPPNPSGTPHSAIGNPWMFNNRFLDEETGLFDYRSRSYDTGKGRFLQQDSLGNWGDSTTSAMAMRTWATLRQASQIHWGPVLSALRKASRPLCALWNLLSQENEEAKGVLLTEMWLRQYR